MSEPRRQGGSSFRQRLAMYMTGVAIGLLLLGWFQMQKQRAASQRGQGAPAAAPSDPAATGPALGTTESDG